MPLPAHNALDAHVPNHKIEVDNLIPYSSTIIKLNGDFQRAELACLAG